MMAELPEDVRVSPLEDYCRKEMTPHRVPQNALPRTRWKYPFRGSLNGGTTDTNVFRGPTGGVHMISIP